MSDPGLRINGENVAVTIFADGTPFAQSQIVKNFTVEPKITEHDDAFLGSDADDPDQQLRGWTFKGDTFVIDTELNDMLIAREAKKSARQPFERLSIGFVLELRNGTNKAYFLQKVEIKPMSLSSPGAAERVMNGIEGRAKYLKPAVV